MTLTPENKADALADAFLGLCGLLHERGILSAEDVAKRLRGGVAVRAAEGDAGRAKALDGLVQYLEKATSPPHTSPPKKNETSASA